MARFCVHKDKMTTVLKAIKGLDGQVATLVNMSDKQLVSFFSKSLGEKEGKNLATEFSRAKHSIRARALGDWMKKNLDKDYRAKRLKSDQRRALNNYIEGKLYKSTGGKSEIVSSADVMAMTPKKRDAFLKKFYTEGEARIVKEQIDVVAALEKESAMSKKVDVEIKKEVNLVKKKIETFLNKNLDKKKTTKSEKKSPSMNDIVKMGHDERLKYLKSNGVKDAEKLNDEITKKAAKVAIMREANRQKSVIKKQLNTQKRIIDKFFDDKFVYKKRSSVSMDEITQMSDNERIAFLQKTGVEDPLAINEKIKRYTETQLEKDIRTGLSRETNIGEMQAFVDGKISEVVNEKGRIGITQQDLERINAKTEQIRELKSVFENSGKKADREAYGEAIQELKEIARDAVGGDTSVRELLVSTLGLQRALLATGEFSAVAIQGGLLLPRVLFGAVNKVFHFGANAGSNPARYFNVLTSSFRAMSEKGYKRKLADYITRDTAKARKISGLRQTDVDGRVTGMEEDFMTRLFDIMQKTDNTVLKTTGSVGNMLMKPFSRFQSAYLTGLRVESFDDVYIAMQKAGVDIDDQLLKDLAATINDVTGGSTLGFAEKVTPEINAVVFSARNTVGTIKSMTVRPVKDLYRWSTGTQAEKIVAVESVKRLLGGYGLMVSLFGLFKMAENGGANIKVETDPTSSEFGDVVMGSSRLNIMGGKDWYITLMARMFADAQKSPTTGVTTEYGTGYGQTTRLAAIGQTARGKLSPNFALIFDAFAGENVVGERFFAGAWDKDNIKALLDGDHNAMARMQKGLKQEAFNRGVPMAYQAGINLGQEDPTLLAKLFAPLAVGYSVNTYGYTSDWTNADSNEKKRFLEENGYEKALKAGDEYGKLVNNEISSIKYTDEFLDMSDEDKQKKIDKIKREAKKTIYNQYKFKP